MCLEEERSLKGFAPEPQTDPCESGGVAVQRLYDACRAAFSQAQVPFSSQAVQRVRLVLDSMKPADVGLDENMELQNNEGLGSLQTQKRNRLKKKNFAKASRPAPCISYVHLYECDDFSMGIFCLPVGAVIPLHNHPNMTVLSKLLYGSMHVKAYDWANHSDTSHLGLAKLVVDRTMSAPCNTAVLYPTSGGNIHQFTAVTTCAVLDVLAPPYSKEDGRHCTYYREVSQSRQPVTLSDNEKKDSNDHKFVWLDEFQTPPDFLVRGAPYMGPRIIPDCV